MRGGQRYRHIHSLDVDLFVAKIVYRGPTYFKAKVRYWNRFYRCFCHESVEVVKIHYRDLAKWRHVGNQ